MSVQAEAIKEAVTQQVRQMQLVTGGLCMSPLLFSIFTIVAPIAPLHGRSAEVMVVIGLAVALLTLLLGPLLGSWVGWLAKQAVLKKQSELDSVALAGAKLTGQFLCVAILGGGAFVALLAFWVSRSPWAFGAAVVNWLTAFMYIPSLGSVAKWVNEQQR